MDVREGLFSFGTMGISVLAAYFLFRKKPRESVVSRGPLFIVCFLAFFSVGFAALPLALPGVFECLLDHSVFVTYLPPARINVTKRAECGGLSPFAPDISMPLWVEWCGRSLTSFSDAHGN